MKEQLNSIRFNHDAENLGEAILINGIPILQTGFPPDIYAPKRIVQTFEGMPLEEAIEMIGDNYILAFFVGKVVCVTDRKFREKVCLALAKSNQISRAIEKVWNSYVDPTKNPVTLLYAVTMACHRFSNLPHAFQIFLGYSVDIPNLN